MEGGEEGGDLAALPPDSHMDLLGQWLKVSLYCNSWLCVCERLSGSLFLLCLQSDLSGLQGGETEGERGRETTPVAGRQQLPTSWPGVLTPNLTSMGTERSPLLSWLTVGTRRDLHFPHSRCSWLGRRARGTGPWTEEDMTGQDSFGGEISRGRAGLWGFHRRAVTGPRWHRLAVGQAAMQLSSQSLASQRVS